MKRRLFLIYLTILPSVFQLNMTGDWLPKCFMQELKLFSHQFPASIISSGKDNSTTTFYHTLNSSSVKLISKQEQLWDSHLSSSLYSWHIGWTLRKAHWECWDLNHKFYFLELWFPGIKGNVRRTIIFIYFNLCSSNI